MTEETSTKDKILHNALDLLQTRSYNAFSYRDIAERLNIKKASIHYHFPSKTDLGVKILQDYRTYIIGLINDLEKRTDDPAKKLRAFFSYFKGIIRKGDKICTECILSAEYNTLPETMQKELQGLFDDHHSWLAGVLEEGRKSGIFSFTESPEDKAIMLKATVQGALTIARAFGKPDVFYKILNQLDIDIKRK